MIKELQDTYVLKIIIQNQDPRSAEFKNIYFETISGQDQRSLRKEIGKIIANINWFTFTVKIYDPRINKHEK